MLAISLYNFRANEGQLIPLKWHSSSECEEHNCSSCQTTEGANIHPALVSLWYSSTAEPTKKGKTCTCMYTTLMFLEIWKDITKALLLNKQCKLDYLGLICSESQSSRLVLRPANTLVCILVCMHAWAEGMANNLLQCSDSWAASF